MIVNALVEAVVLTYTVYGSQVNPSLPLLCLIVNTQISTKLHATALILVRGEQQHTIAAVDCLCGVTWLDMTGSGALLLCGSVVYLLGRLWGGALFGHVGCYSRGKACSSSVETLCKNWCARMASRANANTTEVFCSAESAVWSQDSACRAVKGSHDCTILQTLPSGEGARTLIHKRALSRRPEGRSLVIWHYVTHVGARSNKMCHQCFQLLLVSHMQMQP